MDSPAVVFRRRSGWEASDLGVFLWRSNLVPMLLFMGIPAALLISVYMITARMDIEWVSQIVMVLVWWLKPLLDRFGLQVVSVRFFKPRSPIRDLFKDLGKTLRTGLLGDLLWRRFSPYRSARMPLLVLERVKGKTYRRRKQLLTRNGLGFGLPLTFICIGISMALNLGELLFLQNIFSSFSDGPGNIFEFINEKKYLFSVLFYINELLIETLYVCMGFCLYINSRVETEGWDIELLFKTCVEKTKRTFLQKLPAIAPVVILLFFFGVNQAWAEKDIADKPVKPETFQPAPVSKEAEETIARILESPEFGTEKPSRKIQFKKSKTPSENKTKGLSFPGLREILGMILRFVLGAALAAALGIGAYFAYRYRKRLFPGTAGEKSSIYKKALPDEPQLLLQQAEEFNRKGKKREAWALCFRAFTAIFSAYWFIPIPAEATENETLCLVRQTPELGVNSLIDGFAAFVRQWISFAYGGREPEAGAFEQALASCRTLLEKPEANA